MLLNLGQLADTFGVARSTISAWVKEGLPVVDEGTNGKAWTFESLEAFDWWAENKRRRPRQIQATGKRDPDAPESYEEAERRKMIAGADKAELELAKSAGRVVEIDDVAAAIADMHVKVSTRLQSIGNKVRVRVRSLFSDDRAVEEAIVSATEAVVGELMAELREDPFGEAEAA